MRNFFTYGGHYLVDRLGSRARCRILVRGRADDIELADAALTADGWTRVEPTRSSANSGPTDRVYVRVVRVSMTDKAIEDIAIRVHTLLFDAYSGARIVTCSLDRIRYQDWSFEHLRPGQGGLVDDGRPVTRMAEIRWGSAAQDASPPDPETQTDSFKWTKFFTVAVICAAIIGAVGMYALTPALPKFGSLPPMYPWLSAIGAVLVLAGGALIAAQRLKNRWCGRKLVAPEGLSLWQLDSWARSKRALVGDEIIGKIERFRARWSKVTVVVAFLTGGAVVGLMLRYIGETGAATVAVAAVVILLWVIGWEMVRSRAVKHGSRALGGLASVAMLAGIAAFVIRIPTWAMYQPFGYAGIASELSMPELIVNASPLLFACAASAVMIFVFWLWSPHFPRIHQSIIGCVVFITAASTVILAAISPGVRSEKIVSQNVISANTSFRPGCLLQNQPHTPVWVLAQSPRRLLVGDRTPGPDIESPIGNIRSLPANISYQILNGNKPCS